MNIVLAMIGGLIFGSFLNVVLWRLPEGRGIGGRSECRTCKTVLKWYDLFPVISYLVLRGRCRSCHAKIHIRYPIVELTCGVCLGLYASMNALIIPDFLYAIAVILVLLSLFFFDLFYFTLPDQITLPSILAFGVVDLYRADSLWYFGVGLLAALFFAILYAGSRGKGLGFGDVKLGLLIGLMLGYPFGATSIIMGVWAAAIVGLGLVLARKATRKDPLPLGAFLTAAAIISLIFSYDLPFIRLVR